MNDREVLQTAIELRRELRKVRNEIDDQERNAEISGSLVYLDVFIANMESMISNGRVFLNVVPSAVITHW